jgi:hypothetical protein
VTQQIVLVIEKLKEIHSKLENLKKLITFLLFSQRLFVPMLGGLPKKSILKKTNSFTMRGFSPLMLSSHSNSYSTVTGAESRMRLAFDAVFRKSATLQDVEPTQGSTSALPDAPMDPQLGPRLLISGVDTPMASMATLTIPGTPSGLKKVTLVS